MSESGVRADLTKRYEKRADPLTAFNTGVIKRYQKSKNEGQIACQTGRASSEVHVVALTLAVLLRPNPEGTIRHKGEKGLAKNEREYRFQSTIGENCRRIASHTKPYEGKRGRLP